MPGLRKAQEARSFGLAQLTASSCVPMIDIDIAASAGCRANNDRVRALAAKLKPDIVLLHGTWETDFDHAAATVAALKRETGARVVVLGPVPLWKRGLPNEVLRHWLLYHSLIPARSQEAEARRDVDDRLRAAVVPEGAEFISARDALCNDDGCLARLGDHPSDITASDQAHLTEMASEFLVAAIIDKVLAMPKPRAANN
jgi:hypothetical protein